MNTSKKLVSKFQVICLGSVLASCGGGGGGSGQITGIDGSGSPLPSVSSGTISGFGSVLVNDKRFVFDNESEVEINDRSGTESELRTGQLVTILSSDRDIDDNPIIDRITFDAIAEGLVTSVDVANNQFTVLGQIIRVSDRTVFEDQTEHASTPLEGLDDIVAGLTLEISGSFNSAGEIVATRIEAEDDGNSELKGTISDFNADTQSFKLNNLLVSYANATIAQGNLSDLKDGQFVEVEGILEKDGTLHATTIEIEDSFLDDSSEEAEAELKGIVSAIESANQFSIARVIITIDSQTVFENGTANMIALDKALKVKGVLNEGQLLARKIEFDQEENFSISGQVTDVQITDANLNIGAITVQGFTLNSNSSTRFEDDSALDISHFGLDDLRIGDFVETEGFSADGIITLTELEKEDDTDEFDLRGPVSATVTGESFTLLGITILVDENTEYDNTTSEGFFEEATGQIVRAEGMIDGEGNFIAEEVKIEDIEFEEDDFDEEEDEEDEEEDESN